MDYSDRLEKCYSGAVFDVLREKGLTDQALPHGIRPLNPSWKLAGPIRRQRDVVRVAADSARILELGFRVFCRYSTPSDIAGRWVMDSLGKPIRIGAITIHAGDYVLADRDGVVIIPQGVVKEVVEATEEVMNRESLVRKAILEGVDPREAYLKYGKF